MARTRKPKVKKRNIRFQVQYNGGKIWDSHLYKLPYTMRYKFGGWNADQMESRKLELVEYELIEVKRHSLARYIGKLGMVRLAGRPVAS